MCLWQFEQISWVHLLFTENEHNLHRFEQVSIAERYILHTFLCALSSVMISKSKDKFFLNLITRQHPV